MTKSLHICRHLSAAGWKVLLLETHKYWHVGARFSNSVSSFHTVPVPETDPEGYVKAVRGECVQAWGSNFQAFSKDHGLY